MSEEPTTALRKGYRTMTPEETIEAFFAETKSLHNRLDAARHCFERVVFTRYLQDALRGHKSDEEAVGFMRVAMKDYDRIVEGATDGLGPELYAAKRTLAHDYMAEIAHERAKLNG